MQTHWKKYALVGSATIVAACAAGTRQNVGQGGAEVGGATSVDGSGGATPAASTDAQGTGGGFGTSSASTGSSGTGGGGDPKTCAEAAQYKTYVGCDFWPTVTGNTVWSVFDYAAVVANAGDTTASVSVERNGQVFATASVAPNSVGTLYLPWVPELKGPDSNDCGNPQPLYSSVRLNGGAYHLTSTVPVTVYQFSALEYQAAGGPAGKDWSSCPASQCGLPCLSYTNDASLLLPTTALTGDYRITGEAGWPLANMGAYFTITGTTAGTNVSIHVSGTGHVLAGGGIVDTPPNGTIQLTLGMGDVVEVVGTSSTDLSGSLVTASAPVQVISGMQCIYLPNTQGACDHIEESVIPAEAMGKHYFVPVPSGVHGQQYGHIVRLYGNVDGTTLSYPSGAPPNAPTVINAGQVIDLGVVQMNFEVTGTHEFSVATFLLGASLVDPNPNPMQQMGDPSQGQAVAVEQYRKKYVFLAPNDYAENYVDIIEPIGASVTLDGVAVSVPPSIIGSNYGIARVLLQGGANNGGHLLTSDQPVGIQVVGYGLQTSYLYPGGLNLDIIAPPPPPPS